MKNNAVQVRTYAELTEHEQEMRYETEPEKTSWVRKVDGQTQILFHLKNGIWLLERRPPEPEKEYEKESFTYETLTEAVAQAWRTKHPYPEGYEQLKPEEREAVYRAKQIYLGGRSDPTGSKGAETSVTLHRTRDKQWFLCTKTYGRFEGTHFERVEKDRVKGLLSVTNRYPRPYWYLGQVGITSQKEVAKVYSAKTYSACADRRGWGQMMEELHHTKDNRWFLLTVVDDDVDSSRTRHSWRKLTEEHARQWLERTQKSGA
ncbi:MAG: hypothetical protein A2W52_04515 [Candidatus Taylorbacteria bacterium RIFCSPHIGHO2_02_49_25]|uniref:Uncharacterized protein n=1 Tax=Candidatus Taylorbacteria bacterium RIFCSPHIGHO2_02_49_25 TaxID=1802305 RepID=A0A1G2MCS1_9BACT|nr:MAG: hypothetical protein A2759_02250 [Candidatus Taylorbacteria bacterium RIFCSPHIGHO2_01_FULL_49_60]OHA21706.1 MAG: hypothetical protein A2W52_04515 [Candidatus Taylorbacteria bacterium RIFCSPHIGHO2_02_49_25]OHA35694.1 MAG: hypothetical protein A2W65_01340 [Candidatus Taylorbacteria bacterium RIFCSPLOWO2_02_50_13]OHA45839.1 MAG: hypothetical protein A3G61_02575 [Candidatus Taylorbacteria bacterium RIFCSPLOWO2_12_FULL_49_67]HCB35478.1 hypothetical protein [Candidatus Taylorbacteria bacteriu